GDALCRDPEQMILDTVEISGLITERRFSPGPNVLDERPYALERGTRVNGGAGYEAQQLGTGEGGASKIDCAQHQKAILPGPASTTGVRAPSHASSRKSASSASSTASCATSKMVASAPTICSRLRSPSHAP